MTAPATASVGNPAASPVSTIDGYTDFGMTLRDWFAGQAIGPTLTAMANGQHGKHPDKTVMESAAADAYAVADAMLAARAEVL